MWIKEIDNVEIEVEFLTDNATRHRKAKNVKLSGIVAQPLSYLSLSLQETLPFSIHSGERGRVASPAAWVFHKGLSFLRRKAKSKRHKDLYGVWYVLTQLNALSQNAIHELYRLGTTHPKWFKTFRRNLSQWINQATPIDWAELETQDPKGLLKQLPFTHIMKSMKIIEMN